MIDLYTWTTPNGRKASIALEELGLPYTTHPIDIGKDEQFKPEFLRISPNNRIPAIIDRENGISLMESGAILIYLADMTGKLLPKSGEGHYRVLEWLMWQMGGPGPMFGQVHHFVKYNKLCEIQQGEGALRGRALPQGGASALQRARPPARPARIRRQPLLHRRHRHLAMGLALRMADCRSQCLCEREALVHGYRRAPRRAAGL